VRRTASPSEKTQQKARFSQAGFLFFLEQSADQIAVAHEMCHNAVVKTTLNDFAKYKRKSTMIRMVSTTLLLIYASLFFAAQLCAVEPTVQETREGNHSVIKIKAPDGGEKVYRIDLSPRHSPASEKTEILKKWESYRLGAFICFNTNQFTGEELCKIRDPKIYNPSQLDVAGWVATFKAAGMKYAVLTTRHTSGFLLWDSATTDLDVAQSGNKTDVCKEFVKECRRQGLIPAFYYCLWGGKDWNPDPNARAIILAQLYELATQHGEIPYFWIDMKNWAPTDLSTQEIYDCLKFLQPDCVVEFNQHIQDGKKIAYFPTDVLDGELTPPPATGHNPLRTVGDKKYYLPFDYNLVSQSRAGGYAYDPLGPSCWFTYGDGRNFTPSHPFPAEALAQQVRLGYKRGASNVLLATAPDHTGRMRPEDAKQLRRLGRILRGEEPPLPKSISQGCRATASSVWENRPEWAAEKAVDGDSETRWGGGIGTKQGWLELDLGSAKQFDAVLIEEGWGRIQCFGIQVKDNDQWRTIFEGKEIGPYFLRHISPTTARYVRLNILEARDVPTIWEFQLFDGAKKR
jgi:alpha-L-fucosidase